MGPEPVRKKCTQSNLRMTLELFIDHCEQRWRVGECFKSAAQPLSPVEWIISLFKARFAVELSRSMTLLYQLYGFLELTPGKNIQRP